MFLEATEATTRLQLLCTATIVNEDTVLSVVEDSRRDGNVPNFFETDSSQAAVVRARSQVISRYQTTDDRWMGPAWMGSMAGAL